MNEARWYHSLSNFIQALSHVNKAVSLVNERELSELERQGLIHCFEYTHELVWHLMKDFIRERGRIRIAGPADAIREAHSIGLISDRKAWMAMIGSRDQALHTYEPEIEEEVIKSILEMYAGMLNDFSEKMQQLRKGEQSGLF